ncbi:MAG: T9SS type A sorting domain-containing protein [Paludibacteraceae bacterium]|nr:T9SS type A sorting domain-containing protein [Paludibacteraceae bacterium]MBR2260375.1 T9SS type A sorting domain-containing protein [Paludibacteraceae bacterium]MEE3483323.1 T9SS type A sorting domain-containing protein [Bacteroidales bacterium]
MKRIALFISSLFLLALTANAKEEGTLRIVQLDNNEQREVLSIIGKITFSSEDMYLYSNDNQLLAQTSLKSIRKIVFEGEFSNNKEIAKNTLCIYPNPTQDVIVIDGLEKNETTRIYNLQGILLKTVQASEKTLIDVSSLAKGTYLLQVGTQIVKFIKD